MAIKNLHTLPNFLSITQMLKATMHTDGADRYIYLEASKEMNSRNEIILTKALKESADYFLKYGNIDIDHATQVNPAHSHSDRYLFEIGRPVDVRIDGKRTFIKSQIYSGTGPAAEKANEFWDSITSEPAQSWHPNIGGQVLEKSERTDPRTHAKQAMITRIRWTNIGMSRSPTNSDAPVASTVPFSVLAKCWSHTGLNMTKALEIRAHQTRLNIGIVDYWSFRDFIAADLLKSSESPSIDSIFRLATSHYGVAPDEAAEHTERFLHDLNRSLKQA